VPERREWLDVGCGTGALVQTIVERAAPAAVMGVDRSEGFVSSARRRVSDPRARFEIGDAQALPVASGAFDAVVSGLVLNFVPEPPRMLSEMTRATRAGGTVALYVWDYAGAMEIMRRFWDGAKAIDPAAAALDEGARFRMCAPAPLATLFRDAGLAEIATLAIDVPTVFRDFARRRDSTAPRRLRRDRPGPTCRAVPSSPAAGASVRAPIAFRREGSQRPRGRIPAGEFDKTTLVGRMNRRLRPDRSPFLGGQGPAPGYAVSLPEERRDELRERIRTGMPVGPDGSIRLTARAWAARDTKVAAQRG
jgi:SAM-dependent methyltransferase